MRRCSIGSDGPVMSSLTNARSTNTIASTSRMLARNLLPRPSPLLAPSTRPPMSTTCTEAWTTFFDFDIAARRSRRSSGTLATPMFGSFVANGYGAASAPPPVSALYSELLPALGRPTRPKRSMSRPRLARRTGARPRSHERGHESSLAEVVRDHHGEWHPRTATHEVAPAEDRVGRDEQRRAGDGPAVAGPGRGDRHR